MRARGLTAWLLAACPLLVSAQEVGGKGGGQAAAGNGTIRARTGGFIWGGNVTRHHNALNACGAASCTSCLNVDGGTCQLEAAYNNKTKCEWRCPASCSPGAAHGPGCFYLHKSECRRGANSNTRDKCEADDGIWCDPNQNTHNLAHNTTEISAASPEYVWCGLGQLKCPDNFGVFATQNYYANTALNPETAGTALQVQTISCLKCNNSEYNASETFLAMFHGNAKNVTENGNLTNSSMEHLVNLHASEWNKFVFKRSKDAQTSLALCRGGSKWRKCTHPGHHCTHCLQYNATEPTSSVCHAGSSFDTESECTGHNYTWCGEHGIHKFSNSTGNREDLLELARSYKDSMVLADVSLGDIENDLMGHTQGSTGGKHSDSAFPDECSCDCGRESPQEDSGLQLTLSATPAPTEARGDGQQTPAPTEASGDGQQTPAPTEASGDGRQTPAPTEASGDGRRTPAPTEASGDGRRTPAPTEASGDGGRAAAPTPAPNGGQRGGHSELGELRDKPACTPCPADQCDENMHPENQPPLTEIITTEIDSTWETLSNHEDALEDDTTQSRLKGQIWNAFHHWVQTARTERNNESIACVPGFSDEIPCLNPNSFTPESQSRSLATLNCHAATKSDTHRFYIQHSECQQEGMCVYVKVTQLKSDVPTTNGTVTHPVVQGWGAITPHKDYENLLACKHVEPGTCMNNHTKTPEPSMTRHNCINSHLHVWCGHFGERLPSELRSMDMLCRHLNQAKDPIVRTAVANKRFQIGLSRILAPQPSPVKSPAPTPVPKMF